MGKKLCHVGLSAAHNEYMAMHWANRHVSWMRDLFREMGISLDKPTRLMADNKAANLLAQEEILTTGNQFIRTPYHYNKECERDGVTTVEFIKSQENLADIFTKTVPRQTLEKLLPTIAGY